MDPIKIGWKKQFPGEVQFYPDKQHSIQKSKNSEKKSNNKKRVQFNCRISSAKEQAFEDRTYNASGIIQSDKSTFEDHDLTSSSINILSNE
jgi:hypothetical protein